MSLLYESATVCSGHSGEERAELQLITSSIREDAENPKEVVQVNWQQLVEESVLWVFNHHLQRNFLRILGDVADINLE